MSRIVSSSGDLIADRRFEYAQADAREGNHAAAAEMLAQVLELVPHWAPAWFALGDAQSELGNRDAAIAAFQRCAGLDPADHHGGRVALAALGAAPADMPSISADYVRDMFDQYAGRFDRHLVKNLAYRGPELVRDATWRACAITGHARTFDRVLDLGCGTGLFAAAIADHARYLAGVDLAPRMVEKAKKRGIYDALTAGTLEDYLTGAPDNHYDLAAAVDVFVYIGALDFIFTHAQRVLLRGGLFAFTVQDGEKNARDGSYAIGADRRYWHQEHYLRQCADNAGLSVVICERESTRIDRDQAVPSIIMVCENAQSRLARLQK
ncbi:MAG: methyltransferase domain-containing protein [Beijerinckiaceae bacterium]